MKKKITVFALVLTMVCGMLTGCGGAGGSNDANAKGNKTTDIEIKVWNAGLGVEWLEKVIAGFEAKYPEYNVKYSASAAVKTVMATYGMADIDTTDLYMAIGQRDTTYLEPLDDVLSTTIDGEAISIGEKFNENYLQAMVDEDGHYYNLSHGGGVLGFVYNTELFEAAGITQLPRTTDELVVTCDKLYSKDITPLCHFTSGGYYNFLFHKFMADYDGMDYVINNFYACTDEDGTSPSINVFTKQDGRYYALKAFEKFVTPEYTLAGSNSKTHTEIQTEFLSGRAAMMFNGSWMLNEMKGYSADEKFSFMKSPVLSSIIDKLTTISSDGQLRKLITAIDEVTEGEKSLEDFASGDGYVIDGMTVSKEDWDTVYAARNSVATNFMDECTYIPNYSTAKEGAKLFLAYMYSDEAYEIYVDAVGVPRAMTLSNGEMPDVSDKSGFVQTQFELVEHATAFNSEYIYSRHEIFNTGGANYLASINYASLFSTQNSADRMTADEVWNTYLGKVKDSYETSWLKNIAK